jgi:hypothetical protein
MGMSTEVLSKLQEEVKTLEVSQAGQAAAMAGAQATSAAAQAGLWSTMAAGAGMLIIGIFLGIAIPRSRR